MCLGTQHEAAIFIRFSYIYRMYRVFELSTIVLVQKATLRRLKEYVLGLLGGILFQLTFTDTALANS